MLRKAEPRFAASQLLSMVSHFLFCPLFLIGAEVEADPDADITDCVQTFLVHCGPKV
ncbi:TetR/AcrR family transcriptional regulator C-terminal domain-containing protein [Limimaricola pyoseonensis]|uniref:AefR-like transcriptional repressor, C-terminal region n=1 Tax=Limimaricola pyoseonensis TaxID=521013 RepID=A0A1G7FNZ9_9RHOB|nr:TetR/AcrR family transcriptional regulator C-terminal domain-containing protein [Limimaricola pyoseonensis]SDE77637.1 AefR-like transcriptional repressor, C-terminal region [Limimaricola pyoseonensis]